MISLPGELVITTRTGKYGNFNVAKLLTSIGEFTVKDRSLDQYDAGKYQGSFVIKQIKSSSFTYANRVVIECCAYIEDMELCNSSTLSETEIGQSNTTEDPILLDENNKQDDKQQVNDTCIVSEPEIENAVHAGSDRADEDLFSAFEWPLGDEVRLDSTEDRLTLRKQSSRLKALNYQFDYKTQIWTKQTCSHLQKSETQLPEQF